MSSLSNIKDVTGCDPLFLIMDPHYGQVGRDLASSLLMFSHDLIRVIASYVMCPFVFSGEDVKFTRSVLDSGKEDITNPLAIAVDPLNGNVWSLFASGCIRIVDEQGHLVDSFGHPMLMSLCACAFDANGQILACIPATNDVVILKRQGDPKWSIWSNLRPGQKFKTPTGIAVSGTGLVYVLEDESSLLTVMTRQGEEVNVKTLDSDHLRNAIVVTPKDEVAILQRSKCSIVVLNKECQIIRRFGSFGSAPGQLAWPTCMAIDREGNYVIAELTGRIQMFRPDGEPLTVVCAYKDCIPQRVAVDNMNRILVLFHDGHIDVWSNEGSKGSEGTTSPSNP